MKIALILLNLLAATLVFPAMGLVQQAQVRSGVNMYVGLDRAQVIDRQQLQKMFPDEAENDRYEIPKRFIKGRKIAWIVGYPCAVGFLLNAFLIALFFQGTPKEITVNSLVP